MYLAECSAVGVVGTGHPVRPGEVVALVGALTGVLGQPRHRCGHQCPL